MICKTIIGQLTAYAYDERGQLTALVDPLGQTNRFRYDQFGRLLEKTDPTGHATRYTRDANGQPLTVTTERSTPGGGTESLVTRYEYDAMGRQTNAIYPDGADVATEYDVNGKPVTSTDPLGRVTRAEYNVLGLSIRTVYPDGSVEGSGYDAEGRLAATTNRMGEVTRYAYDALGRLVCTIAPDGATVSNEYNLAGRLVASTDARGNVTDYEYDVEGRRNALVDALGQVSTNAYDANGNLVSVTDPMGHTTVFEYDALNRRVRAVYPDGTAQQTVYDALGRKVAESDQAGVSTAYGYDPLGRLLAVTNALGFVTRYEYDELGQQTAQIDANGHVTRFEYDSMGRRARRILPAGQIEIYAYDSIGNLTNRVDFNGRSIAYAYDSMGRMTYKGPVDGAAPAVTYTYDVAGRRTAMSDASGVTTYTYDERGRLLEKNTPQCALTYTYDANDNVLTIRSSNSNGVSLTYTYDELNRLKTVNDGRTGLTMYNYDAVGNLQDYIYPNGVSHSYRYDELNRLTNLTVNALLTPIAGYSYTLGPAGHRLSVAELTGRTVKYGYDVLYRLTNETISGAVMAGRIAHTYDPVGNRLSRDSTVANIFTRLDSYDLNDRLDSDIYESNGNTVSAPLTINHEPSAISCSYDFENRIVSATSGASVIHYLYDGDGNRVQNTVNGETIRYLVDDLNPSGYPQILAELVSGVVSRVYTYGLDLIAQSIITETNMTHSFYGYDGHGNVRFLTDSSGQITDTYDYDAFGVLIARTGTTPNNYLYSGEQFDADLGLYYLRARYMDPDRGRFWSMDPFGGIACDPSSLHKYIYCMQNPGNRSDPSGEFSLINITMAVSIAVLVAWDIWNGSNIYQAYFGHIEDEEMTVRIDPIIIRRPPTVGDATYNWTDSDALGAIEEAGKFWKKYGITLIMGPLRTVVSAKWADLHTDQYGGGDFPDAVLAFYSDQPVALFVKSLKLNSGWGNAVGTTIGGLAAPPFTDGLTIAHELGHVFGLHHWLFSSRNIMWPTDRSGDEFLTRTQLIKAKNNIREHKWNE